jgi:cyanophycinase
MTRTFALLGSGEFEDWTDEVDRWLLERAGGDGRVLISPLASAHEGPHVFDDWAAKGMSHYAQTGIPAQVVPIREREDASNPDLIEMLDGASVIFFSGGNPAALCRALLGTPFWAEIERRLDDGLAYAGCSAGVACLGERAPDSDNESMEAGEIWQEGFRLFTKTWFGPHWDALDSFRPGLTDFIVSSVPPGDTLVGIDEDTAIVGDGKTWEIMGRSGVHVMRDGVWEHRTPGDPFTF